MPLPKLVGTGELPIGVHSASLSEMVVRFGVGSRRRRMLARRLERVFDTASGTGCLVRFIVFETFVTAKKEPNDVGVFMTMGDNFEVGKLSGEAHLLFNHATAQSHFGCSVFWIRQLAAMGGEQTAIEDWQIKRDGSRRGIVEITGD